MSLPSGILQRLAGVLISVCLIACPVLAQSLEVIDLKYRTAAEVIPVLQPLVEQGGALTGQDYKLFVRASPANLRQLRAALEQIDRKPNQLLVSVRRSTEQEIQLERARVSGTVSNRGADVSVQATESNARDHSSGIASVQVIEGSSAFISSGSDVPIVTSVAAGAGRRPFAAATTSYRNVSSGFLVTPRVNGTQVVLDIEQQDERVANGSIQTQRLTTQVSGPLGEWIRLGGVNETASTQQRGILSRQYSTQSDAREIWVKVESAVGRVQPDSFASLHRTINPGSLSSSSMLPRCSRIDGRDQAQAQSAADLLAIAFQPHERLQDALPVCGRNAGAVVRDLQHDRVRLGRDAHVDAPAGRHVFDGVLDQVHERLREQLAVAAESSRPRRRGIRA